MEGLKDNDVDEDDKKKFCGMLQRLQQQLNTDESVAESVEEQLDDPSFIGELDRNSKRLWDSLSSQEKRIFCKIQEQGEFAPLVELWKPWWMQNESPLIDDESKTEELFKVVPPLYPVENFDELINGKTISDKICFMVVNIIYGYAYIMRLYNGDCSDLLLEVAHGLQSISAALGDAVFSDASQALSHCMMSLESGHPASEFSVSKEFSIAVIQDVVNIVKGPNCFRPMLFIESCLSHCIDIFSKANKHLNKEKKNKETKLSPDFLLDSQKMYFRAKKKLEFLISWASKFGHSVSGLSSQLEDEFHARMSIMCKMNTDEEVIKGVLSQNRTSLVSQPKISGLWFILCTNYI